MNIEQIVLLISGQKGRLDQYHAIRGIVWTLLVGTGR